MIFFIFLGLFLLFGIYIYYKRIELLKNLEDISNKILKKFPNISSKKINFSSVKIPKDFPFIQIFIALIGVAVVTFVGIFNFINYINISFETTQTNVTSAGNSINNIVPTAFGLIAVGIIVVVAFGLISIFSDR